MTLQFPTKAEQVAEQFRTATKTVSLARLAKLAGAEVERDFTNTTYWFDDDTSIVVTGRGPSHRMEVRLP